MIAIKNILVATDFSESSTAALEYGRAFARQYLATLHVLHVLDDLAWKYSLDMSPNLLTSVQNDSEQAARDTLATHVTPEDRAQLRAVATTAVSASAAKAIVDYAQREAVDLIVVGTHGRGLSRVLLGSVAERVVRRAPCPMLTVRHPEREFMAPDALVVTERV